MIILLDFPLVVKKYSPYFRSCFSEEGYEHFQKALSGFIVSDNKTLSGINEMFVFSPRHQSSFNSFFNEQNFSLDHINDCRLELLQSFERTKLKAKGSGIKGVLSVDNTLLKHYGKNFDNIYYQRDYVYGCYRWSHDLVTLYYSDDQTDYPIFHQLWTPPDWEAVAEFLMKKDYVINQEKWKKRKTEARKWRNYIRSRYGSGRKKHPEVVEIYKTKNHIAEQLIRKFCLKYPTHHFPIALDNGFTSAEFCEIIVNDLKRDYVGSLREDQNLMIEGKKILFRDFIKQLKRRHYDRDDEKYTKIFQKTGFMFKGQKQICYAYIANHKVRGFAKKQRVVISYLKEDFRDKPSITISNRLDWKASGILRIRRHRWPVETYHQEAKAEGLEKYQVRNIKAIQTYIALVVVAFSMLKCSTQDAELLSNFQQQLQTKFNSKNLIRLLKDTNGSVSLPFIRKLLKIEAMTKLIEYVYIQFKKGQSIEQIFAALSKTLIH